MKKQSTAAARQVALMGMLFALAAVLSALESLFPVLPMLPPGVKLGLSNIVTMHTLFFMGTGSGMTIAVLKALFVLLTRGPTAACLSLAGGLASVAAMALLLRLPGPPAAALVSICGAVLHNLGQLAAAALVLRSAFAFAYLPVMVLSGTAMGLLTALLLRLLGPYLRQINQMVLRNNR